MMKLLRYCYRRLRLCSRFLRFWHTLFHFHCAVDVVNYDGTTVIGCQCGKTWGAVPEECGWDEVVALFSKE